MAYGYRYWEQEEPQTAKSKRILVNFYPQSQRLQIAYYLPLEFGETRVVRCVTLTREDFAAVRELLLQVFEEWS